MILGIFYLRRSFIFFLFTTYSVEQVLYMLLSSVISSVSILFSEHRL